jgi:Protein of unknown function (DUF3300)
MGQLSARNVTRFTIGSRNLAEISNVSVVLGLAILLLLAHPAGLFAQNDSYAPQSDYEQRPDSLQPVSQPPLARAQIEQLVAPIALYPDPLVAQVLAASTYPAQVEDADRWREAQGYASPEQIAEGADIEPWDPAVKALTAFPRVLAQMDRNLEWTTDLGNAYYNQPQDVLEAVQVMRRRARAAGTLETTPQTVVGDDQGVIEIASASPQLVYVPTYNPWAVYGEPVQPYPGFSLLDALGQFVTGGPLRYGLGIAISAFTHTPWGWLAWGLNWLTQAILFNHDNYFTHSTTVADWGFPHRGFHAYAGRLGGNRFSVHDGGMRSGAGWSHFGRGEPGGNSFDRGREWRAENQEARSNRGFQYFQNRSLGENRNGWSSTRMQQARAVNRSEFFHSPHESFARSASSDRAPASRVARSEFRGRSSNGFSSRDFRRSSSPSGGRHLFGGGHSRNAFSNHHSSQARLGGGRAPKSFGGGKSLSGGHFHGGGGHSGGHGGSGRHHR